MDMQLKILHIYNKKYFYAKNFLIKKNFFLFTGLIKSNMPE